MRFPDYVETPSGLQYKDLREGAGPAPEQGDQVMVDWGGYTIGVTRRTSSSLGSEIMRLFQHLRRRSKPCVLEAYVGREQPITSRSTSARLRFQESGVNRQDAAL
ncbi:hypothetical protein R1flu_019770 [Riccia fluitans]|uniref:Uncharacterized protein n=1 Tax=Riccia fluitans TaxID=41844 RepID=A0ABD1ZK05_9MARC